jgi:peptide/nickel transport system ATP-binding protein
MVPSELQPSASRTLLEVEDLKVTFQDGSIVAAESVSFAVQKRERVAIVGESGSGKTASCMAVGGYITDPGSAVTAGRMSFAGSDLLARRTRRIPRKTPGISMMFQDAMTSLDAVWTVGSQLAAALASNPSVTKADRADRARFWLDQVGLRDHGRVLACRPYELSGGMRQRVMLAIALCGDPQLLIADEPTSALDASLSQDVMELMVQLTEQTHASLLIVSHDIRLCEEFADRIVVMYHGNVVEDIDAADLASKASHPYTRGLVRCVPTLDNYRIDRLPTIDTVADLPGRGEAEFGYERTAARVA